MTDQSAPQRVIALDQARTIALACMAVFHFTFDLTLFGYLPVELMFEGFWPLFARTIAASFLGLAGVSLWLAQGGGLRWPAFWRRFALVAAAAALVSLATRLSLGDSYVRFGILHAIAASSLLGVLVLRLPVWLILGLAAAILAAPMVLTGPAFDAPWLLWLGLSPTPPAMMDYEPLLPWAAPLLAGVALGKAGSQWGLWARLARWQPLPGSLAVRLAWPGRHSLAIYLIHQPVLFGLLWAVTSILNRG